MRQQVLGAEIRSAGGGWEGDPIKETDRRPRTAGYYEVEEALLNWFKAVRDQNVPICGPIMKQPAEELAEKLGVPKGEFKCSNGWLDRFKEKTGNFFQAHMGGSKFRGHW